MAAKDHKAGVDMCILACVALMAILAVALTTRAAVPSYGPYEPVGRADQPGLLVVDGEPRVDLNTAGVEMLQALEGIGPVLAERIVEFREQFGPFRSVEELMLVNGFGPGKFEAVRDLVAVSGG